MKRTADSEPVMTQARKMKYSAKERLWQNGYFMNILVRQSGFSLSKVPKGLRTAELCQLAVQQDSLALKFVPEELRTAELYRLAVQQNGYALDYVPEELRTAELCRLAIQQNGGALKYVPDELRTAELCQLAVQQNGYVPMALFIDSGFCLQMVKLSGLSLNHVKDSFIDDTFVDAILDHYRLLYFQQSTGPTLFSTYRQSTFFSQWQKVATGQAVTSEHPVNSLVTFYFQ